MSTADAMEWIKAILGALIPGGVALFGAWLMHRQVTQKNQLDFTVADQTADATIATMKLERLSAGQEKLVDDFRTDLDRTRAERDAERIEKYRLEQVARWWESRAHQQRHQFNNLLQILSISRDSKLPDPLPELPGFDKPWEAGK